MVSKPRTSLSRLISLAIPIAGTYALTGAMEVESAAMMRDLGGHSFAAGAFAVSVVVTARITCSAMLSVLGPLLAAARAKGQSSEIFAVIQAGGRSALLVGLGAGVLVGGMLEVWSPASLPGEVSVQCVRVARILGLGLPFALLFSAARHLLAGLGRPIQLVRLMFLAVPLNAGLGLILSRGVGGWSGLGVEGVALSAVLIEALLAFLAWGDLVRALREHVALPAGSAVSSESVASLVRRGAPLSLAAGLEVGVFQLSGGVVSAGGVDALAAHQALLTIAGYVSAVPLSLMTAAAIVVAEEHAANRSVRAVLRGATAIVAVLGLALGVAVWAALEPLLAIFLQRPSGALWLAVRLAPQMVLLLLLDAVQGVFGGVLRGLQQTVFVGRAAAICLGGAGAGGLGFVAYRGGGMFEVWWVLTGSLLGLVLAYGIRLRGLLRAEENPREALAE